MKQVVILYLLFTIITSSNAASEETKNLRRRQNNDHNIIDLVSKAGRPRLQVERLITSHFSDEQQRPMTVNIVDTANVSVLLDNQARRAVDVTSNMPENKEPDNRSLMDMIDCPSIPGGCDRQRTRERRRHRSRIIGIVLIIMGSIMCGLFTIWVIRIIIRWRREVSDSHKFENVNENYTPQSKVSL